LGAFFLYDMVEGEIAGFEMNFTFGPWQWKNAAKGHEAKE